MNKLKLQDKAKQLRTFRKIHRISASFLFAFFFLIAISGILLGWKKHSNGLLLPDTQIGTTTDLKQWLSLDSLRNAALITHMQLINKAGIIDRMDIRPSNGLAKFTFSNSYLEIQIDGGNGAVLGQETRHSDFIEQIHDGSIIDRIFGWSSGAFKVFYTSIMGLGLLVFTLTGYFLWAGPRKIKRKIGNVRV